MALKKNTVAQTPAFEADDSSFDGQTVEMEVATETTTADAIATPQAKAQATTAIAKAKGTALASPLGAKYHAAFQEFEGQLDVDTVRALGVGSFPKLVADRAGFELGEGKAKQEFGDWVEFEMFSWNRRTVVTPGVDGEDAKALLRTSYDGETLENDARSAKDYLAFLKEEGYTRAAIKGYIDTWGFIVNSEKEGAVAEEDREMVQIQLSPTSVKSFTALQVSTGIKMGLSGFAPGNRLRATIDRREFESNKFAAMKFTLAK